MIEFVILPIGIILLWLLAFVGVAGVAYLTYNFPGRIFQILFLGIAVTSVMRTLLTGRVLRFGDSGLETFFEGDMGGTLLGRVLLLIVIGIAFSICVAWVFWRLGAKRPPMRYAAAGTDAINQLTWAFVAYYIAFSLLPLAFAPRFAFHVSLVYPLFVWLALLLAMRTTSVDPVHLLRQALGLIVVGSIAAAVFMPELALQPGYRSLIPGFDMRLWGVTASANTLGSVAGTLLVLQFVDTSRHSVMHHILTGAAAIALLWSQSKTAMVGALLGLSILMAWRIWHGRDTGRMNLARRMAGAAMLCFLSAVVIGAIWGALGDPTILNAIEHRLDPRAVGRLATFTGRFDIWDYAIRRGMESPLFGQGLSMWDLQTRLATGMFGAVHAHNLFLQAFSRAGLVGLGALIVLLAYIIRFAVKGASASAGGSLALLAMFLVRAITEVPLQPNAILGGEFFAFMTVLLVAADRAWRAGVASEAGSKNNPASFQTGAAPPWGTAKPNSAKWRPSA